MNLKEALRAKEWRCRCYESGSMTYSARSGPMLLAAVDLLDGSDATSLLGLLAHLIHDPVRIEMVGGDEAVGLA